MKKEFNAFEKIANRLEESFYSYEDLNHFIPYLASGKADNPTTGSLLVLRTKWYQNAINMAAQNIGNKNSSKLKMEELKINITNLRRLHKEKSFVSTIDLSVEDKELMHIHLKYLENFINETLYIKESNNGKTEKYKTVGLRGENYPVLGIMQKVILVHYLTEDQLFPPQNLLLSPDKYIISLATLLNDSGTNLAKNKIIFRKKLGEFKTRKAKERISFEEFSHSLFKDVVIIKHWLQNMGKEDIIKKIDNELDLI